MSNHLQAKMPAAARTGLAIAYLPVETLRGNPHNARTHSKRQIRQIAASLQEFGFVNPVLIDRSSTIIAGHGRLAASMLLGLKEIPTIRLEDLTEDQIRAYVIADNQVAANAGWDQSILAIELQHLLTVDSTFDISVTGFEISEIDIILEQGAQDQSADDEMPAAIIGQPVTQPGDVWQMGKHRVFCGDSLKNDSYKALLGNRRADLIFTDPPYNLVIFGNVSGKGAVKHHDFAMASGEMSQAEFTGFLTTSLGLHAKYSASGSVHFICMDWRHLKELLGTGEQVYDSLLNVCVWAKNCPGQGSFYRSQHELVFVFRNGKARHLNNIQLGKFGRYRSNVWNYPAPRNLSNDQTGEGNLLALHPTVKPVQLIADAILDCSARGALVLDGFVGAGSTIIAAERTGRVCYGIELDPRYVDVAVRRWQRHTGDCAIDAVSGKKFDEIAVDKAVQHG